MYIIEGNIGSGKTTFLRLLSKYLPNILPFYEPTNWQNKIIGASLLENFYNNPKRWAYTMEIFTLSCRAIEHIKMQDYFCQDQSKINNNIIISERSIYSGHYCFAQNDYRSGFVTDIEWKIYLKWFNFIALSKCNVPKGFIYLKTSPEKSFERIKKRSRASESNISLDYLKQIHLAHKEFLIEKKNILQDLKNIPVLILDCNYEFETDKNILNNYLKKVSEFIYRYK